MEGRGLASGRFGRSEGWGDWHAPENPRQDILSHAYRLSRAERGTPGVDGMSFAAIESVGLEGWLSELRRDLREKTYKPGPVRRVWIAKPGGGRRPLGIPTIRDRVVQTAAKLVLEPIFEADFDDSAYGYRPPAHGPGCRASGPRAPVP